MRQAVAVLVIAVAALFSGWAGAPAHAAPTTLYAQPPASDGSDAAALARAVADACTQSKSQPTELLLWPTGTYHIGPPQTPGDYPLQLDHCGDLTIDGRGADFRMEGVQGLFLVNASDRMTLKNFRVDWPTPPFLQGTVSEQPGDGSVVVDLDPGFSVSLGSDPGIQALMNYDRQTQAPAHDPVDVYGGIAATPLSPTQLRVSFVSASRLPVGSVLVMRTQLYAASVVSATHTIDLNLSGITVYTAPGEIFYAEKATNLTVDHVVVMPTPDTGRLLSGVSDAVHCVNCSGTVTVTNSTLTSMGDDGVNTPSHYWHLGSGTSQSLTIVPDPDNHSDGSPALWPVPGDTLELSRGVGAPIAQGTVATTQAVGTQLIVTFTAPLSVTPDSTMLALDSTDVARLRISNNLFARNRQRGILVHSRDASIDANTFDRTEGPAIYVAADGYFWEGPVSSNVAITNNHFIEDNNGGEAAGVISSGVDPPAAAPVFSNFTIANNQFSGSDNAAVALADVSGINISDNTFEDFGRAPDPAQNPDMAGNTIALANVQDAWTRGNTSIGTPGGTIFCGSGCEPDRNGPALNSGFVFAPRAKPAVPPASSDPGTGAAPDATSAPTKMEPTAAPRVLRARLAPPRWRVGRAGSRSTREAPLGTTISFRLAAAGRVKLAFARMVSGRKVMAGDLRVAAHAGANAIRFYGRLPRRALTPGSYSLTITATDEMGRTSLPKRVPFTILPG